MKWFEEQRDLRSSIDVRTGRRARARWNESNRSNACRFRGGGFFYIEAAIVTAANASAPAIRATKAKRGEESYGLAFCRRSKRHTLTSDVEVVEHKAPSPHISGRFTTVRNLAGDLGGWPRRLLACVQQHKLLRHLRSQNGNRCLRCYDADAGVLSPSRACGRACDRCALRKMAPPSSGAKSGRKSGYRQYLLTSATRLQAANQEDRAASNGITNVKAIVQSSLFSTA
jgi:hypothetical protein